jgi:hypothetical protein
LPEGKVMKLPFLTFADESIADTDEVLRPLVAEVMANEIRKFRP